MTGALWLPPVLSAIFIIFRFLFFHSFSRGLSLQPHASLLESLEWKSTLTAFYFATKPLGHWTTGTFSHVHHFGQTIHAFPVCFSPRAPRTASVALRQSEELSVDLSVPAFTLVYLFIEVSSLFFPLVLTVHCLRCRGGGGEVVTLVKKSFWVIAFFVQHPSLHAVTSSPVFVWLFLTTPWLLLSACYYVLFDFQSSEPPFLWYHSLSQMAKNMFICNNFVAFFFLFLPSQKLSGTVRLVQDEKWSEMLFLSNIISLPSQAKYNHLTFLGSCLKTLSWLDLPVFPLLCHLEAKY